MSHNFVIAGIFITLLVGIFAMAVQYLHYRSKATRGREWHPDRKVRKPFWL